MMAGAAACEAGADADDSVTGALAGDRCAYCAPMTQPAIRPKQTPAMAKTSESSLTMFSQAR
jgi:hypothetical protein